MNPSELRILVALVAMLLIPGWFLLAITGFWRPWTGLQRWILAIGLSVAGYPVLFYTSRWLFPFLTFGPYKMGALLALMAGLTFWRLRGKGSIFFRLGPWEPLTLAIFGMTLFTRYWILRDHPFPAWSDSLHHTLLTQLTAVQGQLPTSLQPYSPVPLNQYHLGLYSLTATVQWLAQVPAHTALLWTAQTLNGLSGLGVYLVLDRKLGRLEALVGAAAVGLLSHQPAFYVNWGRFTQLASQTIMLIAWLVTWEAIRAWRKPYSRHRWRLLGVTCLAGLLTAAVFLIHFRVAAFYLPLLAGSVLWELWRARQQKLGWVSLGVLLVGGLALFFIAPALVDALRVFAATRTTVQAKEAAASASSLSYFQFPLAVYPVLVARPWLLILALLAGILGLLRRNWLTIAALLWTGALFALGNAYLLRIPLLTVTNLGAVLIMLYLPIGLILGSATHELLAMASRQWRPRLARGLVALILAAGFVASHVRVTDVEPFRYFVTPQDVAAMAWIDANVPTDARFAVNTYFWLPQSPHGTDAGYWIPYFTRRRTTAGTMILSLGSAEYRREIVQLSQLAERLETDATAMTELKAQGVEYVYIGAKGDFSGPGLDPAFLQASGLATIIYQANGVSILRIE